MNRIIRDAERTEGFFDRETEYALVELAQNGSKREAMKARELLIERNMGIAKSAAKHIQNQDDFDDAVAAGVNGIIAAIDGFNTSKGGRLSTIMTIMVRQHIRRYNASTSRAIRLPEYVHTQVNKIQRAWAILSKRSGGVAPSDADIDAFCDWPLGTTKVVREHRNTVVQSLNTPIGEDERITLGDLVPSDLYVPEDSVDSIGDAATLESLLAVLTPRAREVVERHYGIGDYEAHTTQQIGELLGVTKQRAHQILVGAIKEMGVRRGRI